MGAAVRDLVRVGVVVEQLDPLLRLATVEVPMGAPEVAPAAAGHIYIYMHPILALGLIFKLI